MKNARSRKNWLVTIFAVLAVLVGLDRWQHPPVDGALAVTSTGGDAQSHVQPARPGSATTSTTKPETGTVRPTVDVANSLAALPLDQFSETLSRPLFAASRRPYRRAVKPVVRKAPPRAIVRAKPAPHSFIVLGVMATTSARVAILYDKIKSRSSSVRQGDQLGSWRVARIDSRSVTLQRHGRSLKLEVFPKTRDARPTKTRSDG